jgi:SAM-dependent methyltransferase
MKADDAYSRTFAEIYDVITGHKSYDAEVEALGKFLRAAAVSESPRLLDLGCGTGTHAIRLAEEGFDVTGIDLSPEMIDVAKAKKSNVVFHAADINEFGESGFECITCLFNVINCLSSYEQLLRFLKSARERMAKGGVIIVEAWNAIAVVSDRPTVVCREYEFEGGHIRREVTPDCDFMNQRLKLTYAISINEEPARLVEHPLVLFMPWEIFAAMEAAGFDQVEVLSALPSLKPAGDSDRMLAITGRAGNF